MYEYSICVRFTFAPMFYLLIWFDVQGRKDLQKIVNEIKFFISLISDLFYVSEEENHLKALHTDTTYYVLLKMIFVSEKVSLLIFLSLAKQETRNFLTC